MAKTKGTRNLKRKSQGKANATPAKHPRVNREKDEPSTSADASTKQNEGNLEDDNEPINFMALNDDCILAIFDFLKLEDLCAVSYQCQRLYDLAEHKFYRRYPEEAKGLASMIEKNDILKYPNCSDQTLCFGKFERISLEYTKGNTQKYWGALTKSNSLDNIHTLSKINSIYKVKANRIKELRFEKWLKLAPLHGHGLKDVVGKAESLVFSNTILDDQIFKYTSSMEELVFWQKCKIECEQDGQSNWFKQQYPNLKRFAWHANQELTLEVTKFLKQNETIEHFSLLSSNIKTIQHCVQNKIEINELFFKVQNDVESILNELKMCCGKKSIVKRLHLLFDDSSRSELEDNLGLLLKLGPNIDGLYFEEQIINKKLANSINKLENLKVLQVRGSEMVKKYLVDLPNLEELYIARPVKSGTFNAIRDTMLQFASRSAKLKKIYFRNNSQPFTHFKFNEFDVERKKLENAVDLIIYVRTQETDGTGLLSTIETDYETFKIEKPRMEDIKNPLIDEFLYSINTSFSLSYCRYRY